MILNSGESTFAYRCPACGKMVFSIVGVFTLSGDMFKLKCPCGGSEAEINYTTDGKIRITVPCIVCGHSHSHVINKSGFFRKDVITFPCAYSGVDICIIGEEKAAANAAKQADEDFMQLLKSAGIEDFDSFAKARDLDNEEQSQEIADPEMQSIVHFMLCELEDEGNITCKCKNGGHYEFKFVGSRLDTVLIYCTECGASVSVPLTDTVAANAFLHTDKLELK